MLVAVPFVGKTLRWGLLKKVFVRALRIADARV
jgi:hypothetical protein